MILYTLDGININNGYAYPNKKEAQAEAKAILKAAAAGIKETAIQERLEPMLLDHDNVIVILRNRVAPLTKRTVMDMINNQGGWCAEDEIEEVVYLNRCLRVCIKPAGWFGFSPGDGSTDPINYLDTWAKIENKIYPSKEMSDGHKRY